MQTPIALLLAFLALFSRTLAPAGWMPSSTPGGTPVFALCSEGAAATGWLDAAGKIHKQGDDPESADEEDCAFAATAPLAHLVSQPRLAGPAPHASEPPITRDTASPGRGLAAPPPPATGPPALV